jgi:hypothetical protein
MARWTTDIDPKWDNGSPKQPMRTADPHLVDREISGTTTEIFVGSYVHDLVDVFASMTYGGYSLNTKEIKDLVESTYTAKDLKRYEGYLSVWHTSKGTPNITNPKAWSLGKVEITAYYRGHRLSATREIPMVEYGACPEANLLDAGSKDFEILYPREAVHTAIKERGTFLIAQVVADAVLELDEIQRELMAGLSIKTLTGV